MDEIVGGPVGGLMELVFDKLNAWSRGWLFGLALLGLLAGCAWSALRDYGSVWQLAPLALVSLVLGAGVCLLCWRLTAVAPVNTPPDAWQEPDPQRED